MKIKSKLILEPRDFTPSIKNWNVEGVLNPAAIRLPNKKILLYVRIAEKARHRHGKGLTCPVMTSEKEYRAKYTNIHKKDIVRIGTERKEMYLKDGTCRLPNISHFRKVILNEDGFSIDKIEQSPQFSGIPNESEYGVEDPRFTKIGSTYYMTYVGISVKNGVSTYLASSKNLNKWKRLGLIFREQNKDVILFPEMIKGRYVALNRPESNFNFSPPGIWISYSKDLKYWGDEKNLIRPRQGFSWDKERIGGGAPPIKTKKGWLEIYHGVRGEDEKRTYSGGAILLDLKDPGKILARSPQSKPLIKPTERFEKKGFINNVVFPTAVIPTLDNKNIIVYSGGADSIISAKEISLKDVFKNLRI